MIAAALQDKRLNCINDFYILTDRLDYAAIDQVFPLFAEQQFFLDELVHEKIRDANVLDIGLGSGVLSIGAARAGAKQVTALEVNPRAKNFAGFNILLNGVESKITILDGNEQIWRPVRGRQFDYIISNPPFEPTPPGMDYFYHSSAGPYGLDFLDKICSALDEHLADAGHAQIVTAAPGDKQEPSLLLDLLQQHLTGVTTVLVNPFVITFDDIMDRLAAKQLGTDEQVDGLRRRANQDGVTHVYLCVIHYEKGPKQLQVQPSRKVYEHYWDVPVKSFALQLQQGESICD